MMYTMPKNLLSICVNFALATQPENAEPQKKITGKGTGEIFACVCTGENSILYNRLPGNGRFSGSLCSIYNKERLLL